VGSKRSSLGSKFTFAGGIRKESDARPSEIRNKTFNGPGILQLVIKNIAGATG
jgi:hypothetical protein